MDKWNLTLPYWHKGWQQHQICLSKVFWMQELATHCVYVSLSLAACTNSVTSEGWHQHFRLSGSPLENIRLPFTNKTHFFCSGSHIKTLSTEQLHTAFLVCDPGKTGHCADKSTADSTSVHILFVNYFRTGTTAVKPSTLPFPKPSQLLTGNNFSLAKTTAVWSNLFFISALLDFTALKAQESLQKLYERGLQWPWATVTLIYLVYEKQVAKGLAYNSVFTILQSEIPCNS